MKLHEFLLGLLACYAISAFSQTFPERTVRVIIPQQAGGTSDVLGRIVAEALREKWKQAVVIDNRVGANGNIGTDLVAKSAPNGYTWLLTYSGSHAINPALFPKLPFDPEKDLMAVAPLASLPFALLVNAPLPVKDVKEFVALAKNKPGQLHYGAQNGSLNHLLGIMFNRSAGIDTVHVPYRGGPDALTDTITGVLQFNHGSLGAVTPHIRSGKLRPLAVSSAKRSPFLKHVPTMSEVGYPDMSTDSWWGIFVPAGTPPEIIKKINADVNEVLRRAEVIERFATFGAEPFITTPEQFARIAHDDLAKFRAVVVQSGIKME